MQEPENGMKEGFKVKPSYLQNLSNLEENASFATFSIKPEWSKKEINSDARTGEIMGSDIWHS